MQSLKIPEDQKCNKGTGEGASIERELKVQTVYHELHTRYLCVFVSINDVKVFLINGINALCLGVGRIKLSLGNNSVSIQI